MDKRQHLLLLFLFLISLFASSTANAQSGARRILLDTDVDIDDVFALLYLLKQNPSLIDLQAVTINANSWSDVGHSVNLIYDVLHMMGRDDIRVGVGGEGGITSNGSIVSDVGGYLPLIEQGMTTAGYCRYRQAIPILSGGRLDINTFYGLRRALLPQGKRRYSPLKQPTAQEVMKRTIAAGPTTVFLIGAHTNLALFLLKNPHLKKNIDHIFMMGGGIRSQNPTGCCVDNSNPSCVPQQCGNRGNLFSAFNSNPFAEFNIFCDPFAAYQVFHSGIPITVVPLDATNTIPINEDFFEEFRQRQATYEAQFCFQSLKMARDTWFDDEFYMSYFMWDSFMAGVAVSTLKNGKRGGEENDFAEMEFINVTVVTSNKPYGVNDGSNPFFDMRRLAGFLLRPGSLHSGHVQNGIRDPFCLRNGGSGNGICEDGYTEEVSRPGGVRVLVAQKAKPNKNKNSKLDREFFVSFLDDLNQPRQSGRFNFTTQFPCFKETIYKPNLGNPRRGKPLIFDMDMSAGDFISLFYLLKIPAEIIDLRGIMITANGWATAATIDVVYDVLHMMGRDDVFVGLGSVVPLGRPNYSCDRVKFIPHGAGGHLDADTLFGLARDLPRSPRRYTAENSVKFGGPRDTDNPRLRQPRAMEVWDQVNAEVGQKITVLTSGPLTTLASIIRDDKNATKKIQDIYIVGGHVVDGGEERGNVFSVPENKHSEFNFFLDPDAAKIVIESMADVTLVPLGVQRMVNAFPLMLERLAEEPRSTAEMAFTVNLLSTMDRLRRANSRYRNDMFLGEVIGAAILAGDPTVGVVLETVSVKVMTGGDQNKDGMLKRESVNGRPVKVVKSVDPKGYHRHVARTLGDNRQSAVIASFDEQRRIWSKRPCKS
ncbi:inosine-uridine preferring nucleoside hydrolase family protein isoform X2 [Wolffia australiana]